MITIISKLFLLLLVTTAVHASPKVFNREIRITGPITFGTDAAADSSALFQLVSTTQGFLPMRMTTTERDNISTPATGLQIDNITTNNLERYDGAVWAQIGSQDKFKVSSNDTTADFAITKIVAGANITVTEIGDGGNETIQIAATVAGGPEFADNVFRITDDADATTKLSWTIDNIATATTRNWTVPNNDLNFDSTTGGTGSFANAFLSNLDSPIALNEVLLPGTATTIGSDASPFTEIRTLKLVEDTLTIEAEGGNLILQAPNGSDLVQINSVGTIDVNATAGGYDLDVTGEINLTNTTAGADIILNPQDDIILDSDTFPNLGNTFLLGQSGADFLEIWGRELNSDAGITIDANSGANILTISASEMAMGSVKITGLATPSASDDAATKGYVDSVSSGGPDFASNVFRVSDVAVSTKKIALDASAITATFTRTLKMPDADVDLATFSAHLDGSASQHDGTEIDYERVDGSKKNIQASSDDLETSTTDLDDAIGALDASPTNYTAADATIVADHLAGIDDALLIAGGDVNGPASSLDNALVRFDGVTGKLIQDTTITISDGNEMQITAATALNSALILKTSDDTATENIFEVLSSADAVLFSITAAGGVGFGAGSAGSPSMTFALDSDTGIFNPSPNAIGFSTNGTLRLTISDTNITPTVQFTVPDGLVSAPPYAYSGMLDGGWYRDSGSDELRLAINGVDKFTASDTTLLVNDTLKIVDGTEGTSGHCLRSIDTAGNTAFSACPTGAGGDVTAAANMTDNTLIKGDGGVKGIQDSGITIDDNEAMIIPVGDATSIALTLRGFTSQTGNLLEFQDSGSTILSQVNFNGFLQMGDGATGNDNVPYSFFNGQNRGMRYINASDRIVWEGACGLSSMHLDSGGFELNCGIMNITAGTVGDPALVNSDGGGGIYFITNGVGLSNGVEAFFEAGPSVNTTYKSIHANTTGLNLGQDGTEFLTTHTSNIEVGHIKLENTSDVNVVSITARPTISTTDATVTTLFSVAIVTGEILMYRIKVIAKRTGGSAGTDGDSATYIKTFRCSKDSVGTISSSATTSEVEIESVAGYDLVGDDDGVDTCRYRVTGVVNTNIDWLPVWVELLSSDPL